MTPGDTGARHAARTSAAEAPGKRLDIEGLRAVAIGLVLVYHAGVPWLPAGFVGVDVFFVISGFLITGLLVREVERTGRVDLPRFYARRAKRLLPATAVVLVVTAVLTWLTSAVTDLRDLGLDIVAAALYVVNWRLAERSVDYLAEDVGASPVQHFWSLAVEEQFYIVWPLLLLLLAWYLRRHPSLPTRRVLVVGLSLVVVPSFLWSLWLTAQDPATAFFVTPTRLWELGLGAFVAIGARRWTRLPATAATVLGWVGLVLVGASALVFSSTTPWPGAAAALPTLGTAAVIVAGSAAGSRGPAMLLSLRPVVWVGGISYSLYLWHWPLLVAAENHWGELSLTRGVLVAAASVVPAWLSLRLVENPARYARALSSPGLALSVGGNATAVGAVAGLVLVLGVPQQDTSTVPEGAVAGAAALDTGDAAPGSVASLADVTGFVPSAATATEDIPDGYADGCQVSQPSTEPVACEWGVDDGRPTVAVVGDSKILQYQSPLTRIARDRGWRVVSYTKSSCGFHAGTETRRGEPYTQCTAWNDAVTQEILDLSPDVVLTSQGAGEALARPDDPTSESRDAMVEALRDRWSELTGSGVPVVVVLDNPHPDEAVYRCVAENPDDLAACTFERRAGVEDSAAPAQEAAAEAVDGVRLLDLTDLVCPEEECVPVIGGVLVYRQTSHLTDTYVRTMAPAIERRLVPLVED